MYEGFAAAISRGYSFLQIVTEIICLGDFRVAAFLTICTLQRCIGIVLLSRWRMLERVEEKPLMNIILFGIRTRRCPRGFSTFGHGLCFLSNESSWKETLFISSTVEWCTVDSLNNKYEEL